MAYNYDKLYGETENALGEPTPIFVEFFDRFDHPNARILDVGCGQGRDAVFMARKGHHVTGVDLSPNGIRALNDAATKDGLPIQGIVADIVSYVPSGTFDVILIDRTLHMLSAPDRRAVLTRLLGHIRPNGWLLIADETSNIPDFTSTLRTQNSPWTVEHLKGGYLFARQA
ncbi:class I SAM-dependent methyltransferase [Octadecabacter sp. 1_MG-2023]|uniref:class I SAM-dependent methyltransferase n=1 Tax=unclassified Octadecabacter TaxID=196158 RepID=UPI001C0A47B9|nr:MULTISPECIES: class I SAM-dependent methyltransferase [unclassified Octadecabacter]MBU2991926.1 class I SAM-dependent methyltransferase [Octadecabacter sp. B2R22]MDO6735900.1 class I SAM-dependent methyltransferase [Octadecabacter sp. 1_MG-2023]